MKKTVVFILVLCVLKSLCYASSYDELPRVNINSFSDNFDSYGNVSVTGYSAQLNQNWAKGSEQN